LSDLETPQIKLEQLSLGSEQMWRVNINLEEQLLVADGRLLTVHVPVLRHLPQSAEAAGGLSGFELTLERLNASYNFNEASDDTQNPDSASAGWAQRLSAQSSVVIERIYTSLIPYNLWSWRWQQEINWSPSGTLQLNSKGRLGDRNVLDIAITQNVENRRGQARIQTSNLNFDPGNLT